MMCLCEHDFHRHYFIMVIICINVEQHANERMDGRRECVRGVYRWRRQSAELKVGFSSIQWFVGMLYWLASPRTESIHCVVCVRIAPKIHLFITLLWVMTCNVPFTGSVHADMAMTRILFASKSNVKNNLADPEHVKIVREGRFHLIICAEEEMKGCSAFDPFTPTIESGIGIERCRCVGKLAKWLFGQCETIAERNCIYAVLVIENWCIFICAHPVLKAERISKRLPVSFTRFVHSPDCYHRPRSFN